MLTDRFGRFEFEVERQSKLGGTGGWSGRINTLPSFEFEKEGYCLMGLVHIDTSAMSRKERIAALRELVVRLKRPSAISSCIVKGDDH